MMIHCTNLAYIYTYTQYIYTYTQLCGWMMIHCRNLAMSSIASLHDQPVFRDRLCEIAVAFPVAFMLHLWGEPTTRAATFARMLDGVLDEEDMARIQSATHRPLALITLAQTVLNDCFRSTGVTAQSTSRERPIEAVVYLELLKTIKGLGVPLGGCERVQGSPLPFVYVAHLRCFLLIVLCGTPIVHACDWQWATIPLSLVIAFSLLGLEAASVECERPFKATPTKNGEYIYVSARPYESCKIFKGRPRRNAFSKLVNRQYKSFPPDRFCQVEMKNPTRLSNKTNNE